MAARQGEVKTLKSASGAKPPVKIFVSFSHKDEAARLKLATHLATIERDGVTIWFDGDLNAGDALDRDIARELREAHIFVALLSPDYLASAYCWQKEYTRAMTRRAKGLVRVVAVVVRPCDWKATRAAGFKLLPKDGKPVTAWRPADKAYLDIAEGIRRVVTAVRKDLSSAAPVARKPATPKVVAKPKIAAKAKPAAKASAKTKLPKAPPRASSKPIRAPGRPKTSGTAKR